MKILITVLTVCLFSLWGQAQLFDVFQNKEYKTSMRVLDTKIDKAYVPSNFSIDIDKNKDENEAWSKIEEQLYSIAQQKLENEASFFQLQSKALEIKNQFENWSRLRGESEVHLSDPKLSETEIELLSVLNNCGIYSINYIFETKGRGYSSGQDISVKHYYFADYKNNKITSIGNSPSQRQQEKLKQITLSKFKKLYLLQTHKFDLNILDSIEKVKQKEEIDFASKIYYSEAIVYPYFSGIVVEFPKFSKSSHPFLGLSFRVFLKNEDVQALLTVYPELKPAFKKPLKRSSKAQVEQLDNDHNFDLLRFKSAPKEIDMLDILDFDKKVYSMKISSFTIRDTVKNLSSSKKIFLNKNQRVILIERRDKRGKINFEKKYKYNDKNQLISIKKPDYDLSLKLYRYNNGVLDYTESIDLINAQDFSSEGINMEIEQEHFVYSNNYRYTMVFNLLADLDRKYYNPMRFIGKKQFCTNSYCMLTDDNQNIIGVKQKRGALIDILTNSDGQPVESYFDHDRHQHFFTYDEQGRIKTLKSKHDNTRSQKVEYEYHPNDSKALIIREEKTSYSNVNKRLYEYEFEFWE